MKELRRKDRAITEEESMALLNKAEYGVLSTVTENGKPYGVPLNFCIIKHCIYFHCGVEGQKIDNIKQNKSVSFCAVGNTEILPDKFGTKYESVIVSGKVEEVFDMNLQLRWDLYFAQQFEADDLKTITPVAPQQSSVH